MPDPTPSPAPVAAPAAPPVPPPPAKPPLTASPSAPLPPRPSRTPPFRGTGGNRGQKVNAPLAPIGLPAGWWSIPSTGNKGAKPDLASAVAKIPGIQPHHIAMLQAEINSHDSPFVTITGHYSQENRKSASGVVTKGKVVLHMDITPIDGFVGPGGAS